MIRKGVAHKRRPESQTKLQAISTRSRPQRAKKFSIPKKRMQRPQMQQQSARKATGTMDGDCHSRQLQQTEPWRPATNQKAAIFSTRRDEQTDERHNRQERCEARD